MVLRLINCGIIGRSSGLVRNTRLRTVSDSERHMLEIRKHIKPYYNVLNFATQAVGISKLVYDIYPILCF